MKLFPLVVCALSPRCFTKSQTMGHLNLSCASELHLQSQRERDRDNFIEINRKHDDTCTNKKYNEGLCGLIQGDLR